MADVGGIIATIGVGGIGTLVVTTLRGLSDERTKRRAEKKAATTEPLEVKSMELRIAETAGEIQHKTMTDLRRDYADLDERFEKHKREAEAQRDRDLKEAERLREHDRQELVDAREEIRRLKERIQDQDATISRLQFELQQARSGP